MTDVTPQTLEDAMWAVLDECALDVAKMPDGDPDKERLRAEIRELRQSIASRKRKES